MKCLCSDSSIRTSGVRSKQEFRIDLSPTGSNRLIRRKIKQNLWWCDDRRNFKRKARSSTINSLASKDTVTLVTCPLSQALQSTCMYINTSPLTYNVSSLQFNQKYPLFSVGGAWYGLGVGLRLALRAIFVIELIPNCNLTALPREWASYE